MPLSQSKSKRKLSMQFEALGTAWEVILPRGITTDLETTIKQLLKKIDRTWSRFRDDSLVAEMNRSAGSYSITPEDHALLAWYHQLYKATNGSVTPLIGQTLSDAGYDSHYTLQAQAAIARTPTWESCLNLHATILEVLSPCLIDVGAAGKGFAIDQVAALFGDEYVIDAGGDIRVSGIEQTIGLEDPRNEQNIIGTVTLDNGSICGSAGNRRAWSSGNQAWHHIVDPRSSLPTTDVLATWAIAENAMIADGLSTALFFVPPESLLNLAKFDYIVLYADGSIISSSSSKVHLFI